MAAVEADPSNAPRKLRRFSELPCWERIAHLPFLAEREPAKGRRGLRQLLQSEQLQGNPGAVPKFPSLCAASRIFSCRAMPSWKRPRLTERQAILDSEAAESLHGIRLGALRNVTPSGDRKSKRLNSSH